MFFRRFPFFILFALLLVVGLFGLRSRSTFEQGYAAGYTAAQQAETAGESAAETGGSPAEPAPPAPYGRGWGWGFFPLVGILGLFFKFWLVVFFIGLFLKILGFGRFGPHHARHWGRRHRGPWRGDDDDPYEKQPEDVEPDVQHA